MSKDGLRGCVYIAPQADRKYDTGFTRVCIDTLNNKFLAVFVCPDPWKTFNDCYTLPGSTHAFFMKPRLSISIANGSSNQRARGNVAPFSSVIVCDGVDSHGRVASSGTSSVLFWQEGREKREGRKEAAVHGISYIGLGRRRRRESRRMCSFRR